VEYQGISCPLLELAATYQELLDSVRHRMARRLLMNTKLSMEAVAFLLGF
jgi:transcriptional regulator GlxA family with amidase domain